MGLERWTGTGVAGFYCLTAIISEAGSRGGRDRKIKAVRSRTRAVE
jgi:hypothetical protein